MELTLKFAGLFDDTISDHRASIKDIKHPVFLPRSGVAGVLEINAVDGGLLSVQDARIEVALDGKIVCLSMALC